MRRHVHFLVVAPVTAALAMFVPLAYAQCTGNEAPGSGEAIQCRVGNVLSKNGNLLSTLQQKISSCDSTDPNCALLQRHLDRAQKAHARAMDAHMHTSADNYNQLTVSPHYHRNSKHTAGTSGIQSVGSNAPDTLDSDYDATGTGSTGQTISDSLDDTASAVDDANTSLASLPQPAPPTFTPPTAYDFTADVGYPSWLHLITDEKAKIITHFSAKLALNALDVLHDVFEHTCGQTLVAFGEGGNAKLACVALSLAHIAMISTVDVFDFADADLTYWNAKAGNINAQRALQASDAIGQIAAGTSGDVTAIKNEVDALSFYVSSTLTPDLNKVLATQATILANQSTILANQATIMQLLSTPQGQRPGFPTK
jgi:hypothetical protein